MAQNIEGAISPLDAFLMRQKPIYPPKRWIQMPCSLSLPQQIEQSVIKENLLFAGIRKISSEDQKSSCIVHRCTVYDFIAKKRSDTEGMLAGAAPVTFRVEKRTFRADGPTNRGKAVTLDP